jgi:hypothetical protein
MKNNIDKKYCFLKTLIIKSIGNKIEKGKILSLNQFIYLVAMRTDLSIRKSR